MITYLLIHSYSAVLTELRKRISEQAPGLVQLLIGPRQVGRTTLLLSLATEYKDESLYTAADAPEAALSGWWENIWRNAEERALFKKTVLLIDEIQYLSDWNRLLKSKIDYVRRKRLPLHVIVTGSSALQLAGGSRETMAGRFERLQINHWPARELCVYFGLSEDEAVQRIVNYGSYPGSMQFISDPMRWRAYVRNSIIDPAIGRDILFTESIRKPALLRQIFAVAIGHPAEIISLQKICGQLMEQGSLQTVAHYLSVLEEARLIAAVHKFSEKTLRSRSSPPKLIALNQGLLSSSENSVPPSQKDEPDRFGRWVENACIAHAWNAGQTIHYWRAEPLEVDMISAGTWGKWAIEIKTGNFGINELKGLFEFCRLYSSYRPLVICDVNKQSTAENAGIHALSWRDYLLNGINFQA